MTPVERQRLPRSIRAAIEKFEALPMIGIWRGYPRVSQGELRMTFEAGWDPESVAQTFAITLLENEVAGEVFLIYGDESTRYSAGGDHWWVRIVLPSQQEINIDWTARQFYNLEQPHAPQHRDLPCPLIWQSDRPGEPVHPVTGTYLLLKSQQVRVEDSPGDVRDARTGLPRVLSSRCSTCIFRPGNPMHLDPGQREGMVREALARGSWIVCHETLPATGKPIGTQAICRGFWDVHGPDSLGCRITAALGGPIYAPPPTEDDSLVS
ncbi:hypothetical protein GCM10017786_08860 [Amycolatopsis deserti]|uniref:Uncharacterized protein n=1 Tax=Amycolatopsis deserti TaxID=185696 RepID=A0ABQ3IHK3_9PSEU|nr:hypothetical protein [Amycolatopsis deserti]GHE80841.1 hypothetical protein GCM10017786_08860 [Amycolatopsis deserti]